MNAQEWLNGIAARGEGIARDLPKLIAMGEKMAGHLLAGGEIFCPPVGAWWVSEFSGRSGGMMGIRWGNHAGPYVAQGEHDVAYVTLPRKWDEKSRGEWKKLTASEARIFVIGDEAEVEDRSRVEAFTGLGSTPTHKGVRLFEQFVRGWVVAGEMIAACTRAGKMPHIWMSVWLEGAIVRNAAFMKHDNLREPWHVPLFHERIYVPPLPAGQVAGEFLGVAASIRNTIAGQGERLSRAARWIAEARKAAKTVSMVAVGHAYPENLEGDTDAIAWGKSISDLTRAGAEKLRSGDVAVHFGYSPVNADDVRGIVDRGVRFIYSSPYGRGKLGEHENLIWLDLPWRPADATVDVPGYSVRILPMSSTAHTMAYFALLAEAGI